MPAFTTPETTLLPPPWCTHLLDAQTHACPPPLLGTCTHAHTATLGYVHTHAHRHSQARAHTEAHEHSHTYAHRTDTRTRPHTHTLTYMYRHKCTHTDTISERGSSETCHSHWAGRGTGTDQFTSVRHTVGVQSRRWRVCSPQALSCVPYGAGLSLGRSQGVQGHWQAGPHPTARASGGSEPRALLQPWLPLQACSPAASCPSSAS